MIIIGGGFAGLATGIYARLNSYRTCIFEMHDQPGGLCTSWQRKGYTFDGCVHWLVGSSEKSSVHDLWEETGISKGREFIDLEEYYRIEDSSGRTLVFYTDINKLEKHLLEFSPADEKPITEFIKGIRMCIPFDYPPSKHNSFLIKFYKKIRTTFFFMINARKLKAWMNLSAESFSQRFKDPLLKEAFQEIWFPEFSMFFMLFLFADLHNRNAGYPIGGSMPMSLALEKKYIELGGEIQYNAKVVEILTNEGKATGIVLENGTQYTADRVVSAADGYSTLFNMLDEKYVDEKSREPYEKWLPFPPLIFVSLGVNRKFDDISWTVSGFSFKLNNPVEIGDRLRERITVHIFNHDPSMAPEGKTAITIMFKTDYRWWKDLAGNPEAYNRKKKDIIETVVHQLEQRFPGISSQIEVSDVATPLTFERYTGNWKGSFEGWLITPENSDEIMKPLPQTLPNLRNFYMCGQWLQLGGGLPTSIMSARRLLNLICKEDNKKFKSI